MPLPAKKMPTKQQIKLKALDALKRFYGYDSFRQQQENIIIDAVEGRDVQVLMPTGGGKSVCYQIPALLLPGTTIVVSPLIALMNDQVQALRLNGIQAAALHSNLSPAEERELMEQLNRGDLKLLYISPERLKIEFERWNTRFTPSLVAIDEAHCISQWGHDFRPEYTQLSAIKQRWPKVPIMALTATADKLTREDIRRQLCLQNPQIYISSFDRPNISIEVMANPGKEQKLRLITSLINRYADDSGIIYCLSRKGTEDMAADLIAKGYSVGIYHAGLTPAQRNKAQEDFIHGRVQVVCATVAFGMGIDKSNIRYVVHNNMPKNIEGYYQEIGRAGRDGLPAKALMFYSVADVITLRSFINEGERVDLNSEKLARMEEFCETSLCRRRVLLSYFDEVVDCNCGNCDVCQNPPQQIDGTIPAQKILSALARTGEQAGMNMIVDILRGSVRKELTDKGYHLLKTYGAGRDLSADQWRDYIRQVRQLGLVEIVYNEGCRLRITPQGHNVLRGLASVVMAKYRPQEKAQPKSKKTEATPKTPNQVLLSELKALRANMARLQGVPNYVVFSDKSLIDMTALLPTSREEFMQVSGVGEAKCERYWRQFTALIRRWLAQNPSLL